MNFLNTVMFALISSLVLMSGCGGGDDTKKASSLANGTVAAGLISGATIKSYAITNGAQEQVAFATTTSNSFGIFSAKVPTSGPFVLEASGGTYVDEATGKTTHLATPLRAVVFALPSTGTINLTPFSEAATRYAFASGSLDQTNITAANLAATRYLQGVDPIATTPLNPNDSTAMSSASGPQKVLAIGLGVLSQEMADSKNSMEVLLQQIVVGMQAGGSLLATHGGGFIEDQTHAYRVPGKNTISDIGANLVPAFGRFVQSSKNGSSVRLARNLEFTSGSKPVFDADCTVSLTADFSYRDSLAQSGATNWWKTASNGPWGPHASAYPEVGVPEGCNANTWMQQRALAVIDKVVKMQLNYCHHHIPGWLPPDDSGQSSPVFRVSSPADKITCSPNRKINNQIVWQGMDCSNLTSWVYNYAFGIPSGGAIMPSNISVQACTASVAPGVALNYNYTNINAAIAAGKLQPGDLLYIMDTASTQISHVVIWTGKIVGTSFDINQLAPDAKNYLKAGEQLTGAWVIADSHFNGPDYRPFMGWYRDRVSHVRRVINSAAAPSADILDTSDSQKFLISDSSCQRISF